MNRDRAEPQIRRMPGKRAQEWVEYHHQFSAPSTYVYPFVWDADAPADGPFCTDVDGNVLLDFTSHVASAPLGYNNPTIVDRLAEFDLVDPLKIAGQDFYVSRGWPPEDPEFPGPSQLMERLVEITSNYGMDTVFLSNSGAEAVENAIKICYDDREAHRAFTFEGAFHGRTLGALSLNRSKRAHRKGYPEIQGIESLPYISTETEYENRWLTDGPGGNLLADKLHPDRGNVAPEDVAYLILEPVQGEGGYRVPHTGFMDDIAALREEYGFNVIADEIQAGLGRTGEMWAIDHFHLEPDVITSAKGLRVGATISRKDVFPEEKGRISSTWGAGHLLSSLVGVLTLDAIEEQGLCANTIERGEQFREHIADADVPGVEEVRGLGLMLALEFDEKERRDAVVKAAFERGLLVLGCGYKTLRILPPLDVTEREIALGADLLVESIQDAA